MNMECPKCSKPVRSLEIVPRGQRLVERRPIPGLASSLENPEKYDVKTFYVLHTCGVVLRRVRVARKKAR